MEHSFKLNEEFSYTRLITREDILQFADFSHDQGRHHVSTESRLLAHGLLVATLPTKLGGDINFIASSMEFQFLHPVYEGEIITCTAQFVKLVEQAKRYKGEISFQCKNESGEIVMTGKTKGMVWK